MIKRSRDTDFQNLSHACCTVPRRTLQAEQLWGRDDLATDCQNPMHDTSVLTIPLFVAVAQTLLVFSALPTQARMKPTTGGDS